jgi:hypothetical protein
MAEQENPLQKVITKCWGDEAFKARLLADPAATLAAEGVQVPEGVTINVAVDAEDVRTLVIPLPPTTELGDGDLAALVGGGWCGHSWEGLIPPDARYPAGPGDCGRICGVGFQ